MGKCPSCGFNGGVGKFCGKCGARLPKAEKKAEPASLPPNEGPPEKSEKPIAREASKTPAPNAAEIEELSAKVKKNPGSIQNYLKLAEALLNGGKGERAFSTFRAAKAMAPEDPRIHKLGAKVMEALGRQEEAVKEWRLALKYDPEDLTSALQMARLLHETGRRQKALDILQKLKSKAPEHPEILLKIAEIKLSLGDSSSLQEDLSLFRKLAGETRDMFVYLGKTMLMQSFYDGAIAHYREGLTRFPSDPELLLGMGKALLGGGDRKSAILQFERACQFAPEQTEILLEMGRLYGDMALDDKAEEVFDKIRNQKIRQGEIFLEIAKFYKNKNHPEKALKELERGRKLSPHHPEIVKILGEILELKRDPARALAEYESFLDGMPATPWALQGIIRTASALGDFKKVAKAQKAFIQAGSQTPDSWCDLGETLIRLKQFDEATKAYEQAAKLDPTSVRAYQAPELIKIEKARSQGEKLVTEAKDAISKKFWLTAVEKLEKALDLVPRETAWLRLLAEVNLKIGAITRAADRLSKVRASLTEDFWVGLQLARVYEFEEKYQLAIELLSGILKDHPEELNGHLMLLRLKKSQIQGERFERDMLTSMVRNYQADLARLPKSNPLPLFIDGLIHYIFGLGTRFQIEALKRAEELFEETLYRFNDFQWAHRGLSLIYRTRGDHKKAAHHLQEVVKLSSDPGALFSLARLSENFQNFSEARKYYVSLRNLIPDHGHYRKKAIEMASKEIEVGKKDELTDLIATLQEQLRADPNQAWTLYDLAWAQTIMSRKSPQRDEWMKRALLTWNKTTGMASEPPWVRWGHMEAQAEFLKGADRLRALNQNLRICERLVRDHPEMAPSHAFLGICYLGFEDLTQTDRAAKHLETAVFLDPSSAETLLVLAKTYRTLGKTSRVDVMKQSMILLEPELAMKM